MNGSRVTRSALRRLLSTLMPLLAVLGCQGLDERRWLIVQTEHFELITDYDDTKAVELARSFELFHNFMGSMTNLDEFEPVIPTRVHLFGDLGTYRSFGPSGTAGYFNATPRANYIAVGSTIGMTGSEVAFHEYSHYLMRSRQLFGHPVWFDEGHADLVSTAQVRDGLFQLGHSPAQRIETLQLIGTTSIRRLLTAQDISSMNSFDASRFYATGWLLVHYLYFSDEAKKERLWQKKDEYMQLVNQGISAEEAFATAFGMSFDEMSRRIESYAQANRSVFTFPLERFAPKQAPQLRLATTAEATEWLGELALTSGYVPRAAQLLERSLALEPERPRALALLGTVRARQGRQVEAEQLLERALRLAPDSALNHLDYANYLTSRALRRVERGGVETTGLPESQRKDYIERARTEYLRAIELDPDHPEAHTELAFTYLHPGEPAGDSVAYADRAFKLLPSEATIVVQLAEILIAAGRPSEALPLLQRLLPETTRSETYAKYVDGLIAVARGEPTSQNTEVAAPPPQ